MLNLIRLELKRMNLRNIALTFIAINVAILGILALLTLEPEAVSEFLWSADAILMLIELFVVAAFIIYAAVLLSNLVIEEFRSRTIAVLFMYPVSRSKLLMAKLIIVSALTFVFIVSSVLIVYYGFSLLNRMYAFTPVELTNAVMAGYIGHLFVIAFASAGLALLPLFFGMMKYSVPATIVSSIAIVAVMSASVDTSGTNLFSFTAVPVLLGIFGFITANAVVSRAVRKDF